MNIVTGVNNEGLGHLEQQAAAALSQILSGISWLPFWRIERAPDKTWDLTARISTPAGKAVLCIECKTASFQPILFQTIANRPCAGAVQRRIRVLAMARVSPRLAELCRLHAWSWFDFAGNCRLEVPGGFLMERYGREPLPRSRPAGANLGTPEASRVVRALLAPENAGIRWTQRQVVAHFADLTLPVPEPSLALVNKVVQHLRDQAYLEPLSDRGFRVRNQEALLREWSGVYRGTPGDRRQYFTLLEGRELRHALRRLNPKADVGLAYARFSAAELQAPAVRQAVVWLYLDPGLESPFQHELAPKLVDSGENLRVVVPEDPGVFYKLERIKGELACTNPVQTYADLMRPGNRGEEAAEAILQQRLRPAWSKAS